MNPHRVRTRLLAAFLVLLVAALTLTVVGWWGMRSTQQALAGVERDLLPNISHALELAQRTTQLAALAPKLSDSATQQELEANRSAVESLLEQIHRNTVDLQPTPELQGVLAHLQEGVGQHLRTLVELTRRKQALQARLDQQLARLERLGSALHGERAPPADPAVAALWSSLVLATAAQDATTIGRLQADVEALLLAARRRNALTALDPALAQGLAALAGGRDALLSLRQDLLDLDARTDYIVVLTRAHADELSGEVSRYVAQLRAAAGERSEHVRRVIQSNETGMLVLALASLAIAAVATRYVRRLVGEIETITDVMSRLAQGDTAQATPATRRRDELGALARSFEVFRDHLLAKQRLLGELHTQRELLEAVHDSLTDGLAVFDRDGRLLLWNRRLVEMLAPHGAAPAEGLTAQAWRATLPAGSVWSAPLGGETQGSAFTQHEHLELRLPTGEVFDLRTRRMPAGGSVTLVT
ncbi:MAG TPA: PAS-domain containing protein, partial [Ideonella sp.]|nr:PAS-domain containing protein [Ideonella sp.]